MKRYLIRAGMLPHEHHTVLEFLKQNLMGGNVGNLLYANSVVRNLTVNPDDEFVSTYYKIKTLNPNEINSNYDAFIIPLADAFRENFMNELEALTTLIEQLKIPCYVIGAGLRDTYEPTFRDGGFPYDDKVKAFVKAVLKRSSIIGVRGQITCDYLSQLGFKEGRDHMAIGCPSMYTFGPQLEVKEPKLTPESHISINASAAAQPIIHSLLRKTVKQYRNYTFIPQTKQELRYLYTGVPFSVGSSHVDIYSDSELFEKGHSKFFINIKSWLKFFDDVELSFGSRLHGNVAALLAGTPAIFIAKDARERELHDFHHLNGFPVTSITKDTTLAELVEKSDFKEFEKYQNENYKIFTKFLKKNNIKFVNQAKNIDLPYNHKQKSAMIEPPIESFKTVSEYARGERLYHVFGELNK